MSQAQCQKCLLLLAAVESMIETLDWKESPSNVLFVPSTFCFQFFVQIQDTTMGSTESETDEVIVQLFLFTAMSLILNIKKAYN